MEGEVYRRSVDSVVSFYGAGSDTGTTTSTGSSSSPYLSEITSKDQGFDDDGQRGSCVSTSEMLSRLQGGSATGEGHASPTGAGSDGFAPEHGTLIYPSATSDCEPVNKSIRVIALLRSYASDDEERRYFFASNIPPANPSFSSAYSTPPPRPSVLRTAPRFGSRGFALTFVPFNQGSKQDVEALVDHIYTTLGLDLDYVIVSLSVPFLTRREWLPD
jgi:hypothetical protein